MSANGRPHLELSLVFPSVMSRPSPLISHVSKDSDQNALEEKQKEISVGKDEPIVTRRELWSYYRQSSFFSLELWTHLEISFKVYYNGNNVC